jgi:DNA-binding NarL/FixJ family response regulator
LRYAETYASRWASIVPGIVSLPQDVPAPARIPVLPEPLTAREHEVLALLTQAKTNREIAEELVISLRTVECHLSTIYGKLGIRGRAEAMLWALQAGSSQGHDMNGAHASVNSEQVSEQGFSLALG